jgi:hypothetical protein
MKNTIALAYLNSQKEIVTWSADTFGSPRTYPKTYMDHAKNREMLRKKFASREEFGETVTELVSNHTDIGGAIMAASLKVDKDIFTEKGIVTSQIVFLNLVTDYTRGIDTPKWEHVKTCIDAKDYTLIDQPLPNDIPEDHS